MDFVTFTDHDTVEAYDILGWEKDKLVTGVEISIMDDNVVGRTLHLNIYDFTKDQFQEMEEISSIGDLMDRLGYLNRSLLPYTNNPLLVRARRKAQPGRRARYHGAISHDRVQQAPRLEEECDRGRAGPEVRKGPDCHHRYSLREGRRDLHPIQGRGLWRVLPPHQRGKLVHR